MRQCSGCGATFTRGEAICPYCGTELVAGARTSREQESARKQKPERDPWDKREPSSRERGGKRQTWDFSAFRKGYEEEAARQRQADGSRPPPLNLFKDRSQGDKVHEIISAALAFTLGTFGAHWFYRGNARRAMWYCIFFWTGIPTVVGIIEGIGYLRRVANDPPRLP